MDSFNFSKFEKSAIFTCTKCGCQSDYALAIKGCCTCRHHVFKVSTRTGTPTAWDLDRPDPYIRQKQKAVRPNDGQGYKLTAPADESQSGGFGTRFRGSLSPRDFSEHENDYDEQYKNDLPSEDTNLDHPSTEGTPMQGWFADPQDPLSAAQELNRDMSGKETGSLDSKLKKKRTDQSLRVRLDDSIFGKTVQKIQGI